MDYAHLPPGWERPLGRGVERLLQQDMTWVRRRKHRVSYVDEIVACHQISVDFDVPEDYPSLVAAPDGQPLYHLPLFCLTKASRRPREVALLGPGGKAGGAAH